MFSLFAELHQTEELGPVIAIIPACTDAETMIHMMNKQVAAFLYYFLKDAALPVKFIMDLLQATCDATLVAEIKDCDWDLDTQTLTTPQEKKEDKGIDELDNAEWFKNTFDLQSLGKATKPMANKDPEALFGLDANNRKQSITDILHQPLSPWRRMRMAKVKQQPPQSLLEVPRCHARTPTRTPQVPLPPPMPLCCRCHCHCSCAATAALPPLSVLQLRLRL